MTQEENPKRPANSLAAIAVVIYANLILLMLSIPGAFPDWMKGLKWQPPVTVAIAAALDDIGNSWIGLPYRAARRAFEIAFDQKDK